MSTEAHFPAEQQQKRRAVSRWLMLGVAMLVIQILLGGITRLTNSGLSITKWKPLHGAIPPMNEAQWQEEFTAYKTFASGQYKTQDADFSLSDFKHIFWWEWLHREWARLVGVVFLIGFVYFLARRYMDREMIFPMIVLFVLGALQGAVGWIMVASGLNPDDTHVSHIKLALHFMAAMLLVCYTLWFALELRIAPADRIRHSGSRTATFGLIVLLGLQLTWGAFMAGLKAAAAAPTWPNIGSAFIPEISPTYAGQRFQGLYAYISHPIGVHVVHRMLAYTLLLAIVLYTVYLRRIASRLPATALLRRASFFPLLITSVQVILGILTVLHADRIMPRHWGSFEWLAQAHQLVAMLLLLSLVVCLYAVSGRAFPSTNRSNSLTM